MEIFVITQGVHNTFVDIKLSKAAAEEYVDEDADIYNIIPYDIDESYEDLEHVLSNKIVAHCFDCNEPLTKNEVHFRYGDEEQKYNFCFCSSCIN